LALDGGSFPRALADAVPPPPDHCPKGQIAVTSHAGPQCVLVAPNDCGPGWHGVQGGQCELTLCEAQTASSSCGGNARCVPADLCVVEQVRDWGYGMAPAERGPELAAPPAKLAVPQHDFLAVDVCSSGGVCAEGHCEALHVCLPPGRDRPSSAAKAGHPPRPALARSVSETELQNGVGRGAASTGPVAVPPDGGVADTGTDGRPPPDDAGTRVAAGGIPNETPRRGGCAGCAMPTPYAPGALVVAVLVALGVSLMRRRRA
jgi:hypothetical protein